MASGDPLFNINMDQGLPPASLYATPDSRNAPSPAPDMEVLILDFDASQKEYMDFPIVLPPFYSGGGITVTLGFSMSTATAPLQVRLGAAFAAWAPGTQVWTTWDFATAREVSAECPSIVHSAGEAEIDFSAVQADGMAAGEWGVLRVYRDPTFVGPPADDATGDWELIYIKGTEA